VKNFPSFKAVTESLCSVGSRIWVVDGRMEWLMEGWSVKAVTESLCSVGSRIGVVGVWVVGFEWLMEGWSGWIGDRTVNIIGVWEWEI
jgi:hypothetical protein